LEKEKLIDKEALLNQWVDQNGLDLLL